MATAAVELEECLVFSAMAGVFPGAASVQALWQRILHAQVAPLHDMPQRWGIAPERILSAEAGVKNRIYLDRAYCLAREDELRPDPWGYQTRVTTRVIQELVADAARAEAGFDRASTALVLGTSWSDESYFMAASGPRSATSGWFDAGGQVQEVARATGIGGPTLCVDTACSAFIYAVDAAAALIQGGQARSAVVAGVNAFLPPTLFLGFSQLRALDRSGALRAFGQEAGGIVPSECVVAFVLEPMHAAVLAGRRVLGVLRGLGISSDGAEGSVFSPGKRAQLQSYARAYRDLEPGSIDYIEAHGTGTALGDRTECESLDEFFRPHLAPGRKLPIGSIKSLIGHPLAAAGGAALAKTLLMLQHRTLPPHPAFAVHERLAQSCLTVPQAASVIARREQPLRVGISSFGFGGANAHAVIEAAPGTLPKRARSNELPSVTRLDLALIDVEAALGPTSSACELQQYLQAANFAARPFPQARFGVAEAAGQALSGWFLAGSRSIDIDGYRVGPKPLRHVDPFKLLVTHRANLLLKRHEARCAGRDTAVPGSSDTALVVCANMGGERFFEQYRKTSSFQSDATLPAPDIVVEDVATMLPTMVSGYPAQILDLRGFHETVSGDCTTFWTTLLAAPNWLARNCRTLLLGAGRYFSCSADVLAAADAGGKHGEGIGFLLLKPTRAAQQDGDQVLASLTAVVHAPQAGDAARACALLDIPFAETHVEICELDPRHVDETAGAQAVIGYLAEASGIEALLATVMRAQRHCLIEVRRGGHPWFWLGMERHRRLELQPDPVPALPFDLSFSPVEPPVAAPRLPEQVSDGAEVSDSWAAAAMSQVTATFTKGLRTRSRAMQLLCAAGSVNTASVTSRTGDAHSVLDAVCRNAGGVTAQLRVDESHPYFFDHPLDHVPGILLLAGVLQGVEIAAAQRQAGEFFIDSLQIRFKRYAEKRAPISLEVMAQGNEPRFEVLLRQDGEVLARSSVGLAQRSARTVVPVHTRQLEGGSMRLLHKHRQENVLVSSIEELPASKLRVHTLPVPAGHLLDTGDPVTHSMLYFLEIARQCFMLVAHTRLNIPLGTPMVLIDLAFRIDAPLPTSGGLTLLPKFPAGDWGGQMHVGRVNIELRDQAGEIGNATILSQAMNANLYALQRHTTEA